MEIELKFLVPRAACAALAIDMARNPAMRGRVSLAAMYLDTEDRRLALAGMAWRLRREGRRWVQTLKAGGANALERFEHEVVRPGPSPDASLHAGSAVGDRLLVLLHRARKDGVEPGVCYRTEVRRTTRRLRTRGAVVEIAFDEGRLLAGGAIERIREIEFELVSGSVTAMLSLAERWRKRFGLIYDPRSKAERGDRLAAGSRFPKLRKANPPRYARTATAAEAFGSVLDECLAQITRNAIGLIEGDPALRVEHVHQLRVGIRRIRSAVCSFQDWTPPPPDGLVTGLRRLFDTLGMARDSDVLGSGVVAELARVGAPPLALPATGAASDPVDAVRSAEAQQTFLGWIAWRAGLAQAPGPVGGQDTGAADPQGGVPSGEGDAELGDGEPSDGGPPGAFAPAPRSKAALAPDDAPTFRRHVERRLRRWHRRLVADWNTFDGLDEDGLHALRKRIKRQRYAVEFFAPVLRRRKLEPYLGALVAVQDRMGELNDLFVARARCQPLADADPAAWFALGWLAARIATVRTLAGPDLGRLAKQEPPTALRSPRHPRGRKRD